MSVQRDALGKFLPGTTANPLGRPKKENSLSDLILACLDKEIDAYYGGELRKEKRKEIMAEHITNMIVFGEITLPTPIPGEGGRTLRFNADEYMKHLIKTLWYVQPPVTDISLPGNVVGINFDVPIRIGSEEKSTPQQSQIVEITNQDEETEE
jgi:hypothetical protein